MTTVTLPGTGAAIAVDLVASENHQLVKLEFGAAGSVTQVSATNPLPVYDPDTTSSGSLAAAAQTVVLALNCDSAASVQIGGTWVGTLTFEGTLDSVTWFQINGVSASTSTPQPTTTVNGLYRLTPAALSAMRVNMTAFTSGTATVLMRASSTTGGVFANQILPTKMTDGTSTQAIKAANTAALATDQAAVVSLSPNSPMPTAAPSMTYAAAVSGLVPAALATDVFAINGSATKTIRISKVSINGVQTTAGQVAISIIKRSTANAGGTSTAPTRIPYDSANVAATATTLAYTANPTTLGTVVGTITASRLFVPGVASATDAQGFSMMTGDVGQQFVTLRGIAENLAVNLNGVTITGGAVNISIEWTES